jgi:hypothetical protein
MEDNHWCNHIQSFVKSGAWIFKEANALGKDGKYISPRTWEQLNAAHMANVMEDANMHSQVCTAILGKDVGNAIYRYIHDDSPVTAEDILRDKKKSLKKLKTQSNPDKYQGDKISVTIESIVKNYGGTTGDKDKIDEKTMIEVAKIISADQALVLIKDIGTHFHAKEVASFYKNFSEKYPELIDILKSNIKLEKTKKA